MTRDTRRSGLSLILAGLLGIVFFWATDPRSGWARAANTTVVDAIQEASAGTFVGLAGSAMVLLIGLWLMTRRVA
jgi:hypothetical protein